MKNFSEFLHFSVIKHTLKRETIDSKAKNCLPGIPVKTNCSFLQEKICKLFMFQDKSV